MKLVVNVKVTKIYQERLTFIKKLPDVVVQSTYVGHCHSGDNLIDCKKKDMYNAIYFQCLNIQSISSVYLVDSASLNSTL